MELKSKQEKEIEKIEKLTGYQLPNKFKIIGLVLFIISAISISIIAFSLKDIEYNDLLNRVAKTGMILGLLLISLSKEKIEDELIVKLRMQSYNYAVIGIVLYFLIMPFINYALFFIRSSAPKIEEGSDVTILGLLLTIQILTFRSLKRAYNEK